VQGQTLSLSIEPTILQVKIKPGKSITQAYKIRNSGHKVQLDSAILPFEPLDKKGHIKLPDNLSAPVYDHPYLAWFSFQNANLDLGNSFSLKTGRHQQVVLKIRVPENAQEGDYYTTLVFKSQNPAGLNGSSSSQAGIIGTNILLTVSEKEYPPISGQVDLDLQNPFFAFIKKVLKFFKIDWQIPKFLINLRLVDSLDQIPFLVQTKNTGKFRFQTSGQLTVKGQPGLGSTQIDLQPENVLAQSERQQKIVWAQHGFLMGKYIAQVDLKPRPEQVETSRLSFTAFPYKIILIVLMATGFASWLKKFKTQY